MTDNDANELFAAIMGAEDNADLAAVEAPALDDRKDGAYYAADEGTVSVYHVVVDHRVVAHVLVDNAAAVDAPAKVSGLSSHLHEGTTWHPIAVADPARKTVITTKGVTFKSPAGFFNRSMLKAYVLPRLPKLLVRVYGLGL